MATFGSLLTKTVGRAIAQHFQTEADKAAAVDAGVAVTSAATAQEQAPVPSKQPEAGVEGVTVAVV
jgi:hypothetical protein